MTESDRPPATLTYLPPADIARQIADIIAQSPEEFCMEDWGIGPLGSECNAPACIAGHIGRLHRMSTGLQDHFTLRHHHETNLGDWKERQGKRLNLDYYATQELFLGQHYRHMHIDDIERVLRELSKELETATDPIGWKQLRELTARALDEPPPCWTAAREDGIAREDGLPAEYRPPYLPPALPTARRLNGVSSDTDNVRIHAR